MRILEVPDRLLAQKRVAPFLLPHGRRNSFSLPCAGTKHEEERLKMTKLMRELLVIAMLGVVSAGAFAQKKGGGQDKRPPKEPVKVITNDRKDNRPPRDKGNKQPKPDNRRRPN